MDIFGTTITAGSLVVQFLKACSAFSDEACSLMARLEWDLRVLDVIRNYFEQRQMGNANLHLLPGDQALLESTSKYLEGIVEKVQQSLRRIQRKGFLRTAMNRAMWVARRSDLQELEREVYDWTQRFDVRVLGLPAELKYAIPAGGGEENDKAQVPAVVKTNSKLQRFLDFPSSAKQERAKAMLLKEPEQLISAIEGIDDVSKQPTEHLGEQIILSSRKVSPLVRPGSQNFDNLKSEMGELAAALNLLDPTATDIQLLKVESYFYDPNGHRFLFAHPSPYEINSMMTLEELIRYNAFQTTGASLNQCFKLAYKIAEAVFFLHTAGFLHKSITPRSIVLLQQSYLHLGNTAPRRTIDKAYLMGFDLIRESEAITLGEGTRRGDEAEPRPIWEFDVYQHPDRLKGNSSPRYINTYDVYSLGVVLLQIGFWRPLAQVARGLDTKNPSSWPEGLSNIVPKISYKMGRRYQRLVEWCLGLTGRQIIKGPEFVEKVLDPLEEMANALA